MNRLRKHQGFSLIEMTLVLFIMIIGLGIVIPNISSGFGSTQLKGVARDFASALRYARGQALISHQQTLVTIDLDNKTYQVSNRKKIFQIPDEIKLKLLTAQSELNGDGVGSIRFFPDGSSTGGRITLESNEIQWLVDINWLTGHIQILDE
jgi:general secretion pathway protein H